MYVKSAELYDYIYHFKDYTVAATALRQMIVEQRPDAKTLLDVACSTGRHLEYLRKHFEVEGLDINADLLAIAKQRCPGVPLHCGDMTNFDLGRKFDVVTCLFTSITYTKTADRLHAAIQSMARHLNTEGLLFVEPWVSPEQFWTDRVVMNIADGDPQKKVVWMYSPQREGDVARHDINYMVGTPDGVVHFSERHYMGLFRDQDYQEAMDRANLELIHTDPKGFFGNGLYVARLRK